MIHYHGTPISPRAQLLRMAGRNFCISFAADQDLATCIKIGQSLLFDSGAFSAYTRKVAVDWSGYYRWLEPNLVHPHFAVVPDIIDGSIDAQDRLIKSWPFGKNLGAPVWHLNEPIKRLIKIADSGWMRLCLGSSGEYWKIGSDAWRSRMDEAFNALSKRGALPWVHGLRMLDQGGGVYPLASADSTNVGRNFKRDGGCAECKASKIDLLQTPPKWELRATQEGLFKEVKK